MEGIATRATLLGNTKVLTVGVTLTKEVNVIDDTTWALASWLVSSAVLDDAVLRSLNDSEPEFVDSAVATIYEQVQGSAASDVLLDNPHGCREHPSIRGRHLAQIRDALEVVSTAFQQYPLRMRHQRVGAYRTYLNKMRIGRLQFLPPMAEVKQEAVA